MILMINLNEFVNKNYPKQSGFFDELNIDGIDYMTLEYLSNGYVLLIDRETYYIFFDLFGFGITIDPNHIPNNIEGKLPQPPPDEIHLEEQFAVFI